MRDRATRGRELFQAIFVPLCALLALRAVIRTGTGRVPLLSGVLGILIWSGAAITIALPNLTILVAKAVGINRGADLVFYLAILGGVSVCFYSYQRSRRLENLITELVRREAVSSAEYGPRPAGEKCRLFPNDVFAYLYWSRAKMIEARRVSGGGKRLPRLRLAGSYTPAHTFHVHA